MKVTNPNQDRAILACIVDQTTGESQWHEIPAGESKDVDDYVVASTLVEYGAKAAPADLQAARELWAEANRAQNSRTASASASEGEIVARRQATVDVATGTSTPEVVELKGQALDDAVKAANDAGAEIKSSSSADEKREALTAWQKSRGSSTPNDPAEWKVDESGDLILDDEGQPIPVTPEDHSGQDEDTAEGHEEDAENDEDALTGTDPQE